MSDIYAVFFFKAKLNCLFLSVIGDELVTRVVGDA